MNQETALRLLKQNGLAHTPASLQRLLDDGRVKGTASAIDDASLQAYINGFSAFKKAGTAGALFKNPLF